MDDKIGTLSPGKKADIVMLRANDINMAPVYDPIYSIVEIAGAGNVDTVIIDGDRAQEGRQADLPGRRAAPAGIEELAESGARIMREGGYRVATAPPARIGRRNTAARARTPTTEAEDMTRR